MGEAPKMDSGWLLIQEVSGLVSGLGLDLGGWVGIVCGWGPGSFGAMEHSGISSDGCASLRMS